MNIVRVEWSFFCVLALSFLAKVAARIAPWLAAFEKAEETGTTAVLVHGTTGESPTLRGDEPWQLLDVVVDAVAVVDADVDPVVVGDVVTLVLPVVLPGPDGNDAAAVDRLPLTP